MSDTENSRPGLIRAEYPSFGTDRGDLPSKVTSQIQEEPNSSSCEGVSTYRTVSENRNSDGYLRRVLAVSIVGLIGVVVVAGLVTHSIIAVQAGDTTSLDNLIDGLIKTLVPLITLLVGYVCGRSVQKRTLKDGE